MGQGIFLFLFSLFELLMLLVDIDIDATSKKIRTEIALANPKLEFP